MTTQVTPQDQPSEMPSMITYLEPPKRRFSRVRRVFDKLADLIAVYTENAYLDDDYNRWDAYPDSYYAPAEAPERKSTRPQS